MAFLDFMIFYLADWYEERNMLKWTTPVARAFYVLGLAFTSFLYAIEVGVHATILKGAHYKTYPAIVILGLIMMGLLENPYVGGNRIQSGRPENIKPFRNIIERKRRIIALLIWWFLMLSPMIAIPIFIKFGGHQS